MLPFLLLSTRPEDDAVVGEREAILRMSGLSPADLTSIQLDRAPMPELDLGRFAGVFLGGGPFNASDPVKSELQLRVEDDLNRLIGQLIEQNVAFLGLCYGIGALVSALGGTVDRTYGETVGAAKIELTAAGREDRLFAGIPTTFSAFVGHKEACRDLPPGATLLAAGDDCPVQALRISPRIYATQFHPELDSEGLAARVQIYQHEGYFDPTTIDDLVRYALGTAVTPELPLILSNFVDLARNP